MSVHSRKRRRRQRAILALIVIVVIVIIIAFTAVTTVMKKYAPTKERVDYTTYYGLDNSNEVMLNLNCETMEQNGIFEDGDVYIPYDTVHSFLNRRFFWDDAEGLLRYVTPDGIVNVQGETTEYTIGEKQATADHVIYHVYDGEMYLSLTFMKQYTEMDSHYYENPNRLVLTTDRTAVTQYEVKEDTEIRELGGIKSPIVADVKDGSLVTVFEEFDNWAEVCTEDGFRGYIMKKTLGKEITRQDDIPHLNPEYSHISMSEPITMAWHQVTTQKANEYVNSVLSSTKGINVISPTWFYLNDNEGGIVSLASSDYVNYCHQQGMKVWALISNLENPDVNSTQVLNHTSSRDRLVENLMAEAKKYDLDGINIDFEHLEGEAGVGFLEFIRELSLQCRENQIVLSVDNYCPAAYNEFYTMDEQAVFADYIILMAYDEHYNGSDAGSVASYGFVEEGVANSLEKVPAEQLVLGIPFYTRLWKVNGEDVSSETLGMNEAENRVAASGSTFEWSDEAGQYYAEYAGDGGTYKIWLEDQTSIAGKMGIMKSNNLAGVSFWKLGYEKSSIWDTINQ